MLGIIFIFSGILYCNGQRTEEYPPCGNFTQGPPFDVRRIPHSPERQELKWHLYTRSNSEEPVYVFSNTSGPDFELEIPEEFNQNLKTAYLVHGWNSGTGGFSSTKDILLQEFDMNVIVVDWSEGARGINYPQPASNARVAGACTGWVAESLQDLSLAHCVGHSLGGQMCGYMGKSTDGLMGRVTGVDPAGPWFNGNDSRVRIDIDDAQFVDTINTDTMGLFPLGMGQPIGDVDFFPNNGDRQPPCGLPSCDHGIGVTYFRQSITDDCYSAYPCDAREDSDDCLCETCEVGVDCQSMGYYADTYDGRGTFFLRTVEEAPYCEVDQQCPAGAQCDIGTFVNNRDGGPVGDIGPIQSINSDVCLKECEINPPCLCQQPISDDGCSINGWNDCDFQGRCCWNRYWGNTGLDSETSDGGTVGQFICNATRDELGIEDGEFMSLTLDLIGKYSHCGDDALVSGGWYNIDNWPNSTVPTVVCCDQVGKWLPCDDPEAI